MFVVVIARAPKTLQRGNCGHARAARVENACELGDRGRIVIEMLERFAGRHSAERVRPERQLGHIADDRWNAERFADVQRRLERIVDADNVISALLHPSGELSETDGCIEYARAARQFVYFTQDDAEAVLVARSEHLRLRAPRVGRVIFNLENGHRAILQTPHALRMRQFAATLAPIYFAARRYVDATDPALGVRVRERVWRDRTSRNRPLSCVESLHQSRPWTASQS